MKKWQTVIVEDEYLAREHLKSMLTLFYGDEFEIVAEAKSVKEAMALFNQLDNIEVVFLDIELECLIPKAGLDLAVKLQEQNDLLRIVVTTRHGEYAIETINTLHPVGFLLKPFTSSELDRIIKYLRSYCVLKQDNKTENKKSEETIKVAHKVINRHGKKEKHIEFVNISDIAYVIKDQQTRYVKIKLSNGQVLNEITGTLTEWKKKLNPDFFIQIHRSYFVNLQQVQSRVLHPFQKETYQLSFKCFPEERLTIGEHYAKDVIEKLQNGH